MKKALALVLALVMVFSMGTMAFAADEITYRCDECAQDFKDASEFNTHVKAVHPDPVKATLVCGVCGNKFASESDFNAHIATCNANSCPKCGRVFNDEAIYNDHVKNCRINDKGGLVDFTVQEILAAIVTLASNSMTQWNDIESIVNNLIGLIEKIAELGVNAVSQAEVKGAVADLEAALADVKIPKMDELLNGLKQKIKDLYAGEVATTVVVEETTVPAPSKDTGSSSVGIALFAAVSVAAAAAYVCTKKSK